MKQTAWLKTYSIENVISASGKASFAVAIFAAIYSGHVISEPLDIDTPKPNKTDASASDNESQTPSLETYSAIMQRNIMRSGSKSEEKSQTTTTSGEPLSLRLVATHLGTGNKSFAIIEETKKKEQDLFDQGDSIFSQAKLISVLSGSIVIEYEGKERILTLDDDAEGTKESQEGAAADAEEFTLTENEIDDALNNLPMLLSQARAIPFFRDGQSIGMRIFAIRSQSLYEKLGLKNGDIVKSINGSSIADTTQALKLFETLKNERSIDVVLERGGAERSFGYTIK